MSKPIKQCTKCKEIKELNEFHKCKLGRNGVNSQCKSCRRRYRRNNKEKNKDRIDEYRKKNRKQIAAVMAKNYQENREKYLSRRKERYRKNKEKELLQASIYAKTFPERKAATKAKRHAAKFKATPPWLNEELLNQIKEIYKEAARLTKETGIKHHVDHILPLQGETVCGLHVPWNLQILTAYENISKGNRLK